MQHVIRRTVLSLSIAMSGTLGMIASAQAMEGQQAVSQAYDIAPGTLGQVLTRFAEQTALRLIVASELLADQHSKGLQGRYGVQQGLEQLLLNSGLKASINGDVIIVKKAPIEGSALELSTMTIRGQGMGEMTEDSGSYTTGLVSVGSKTPTSLKDTPQTVSIISQQMIEDQRITTLPEAMKRAPGITVRNNNYHSQQFYSRGFGIDNVQIDGASPMDIGTGLGTFYSDRLYDMAAYDHVEVLRGASGLLGGTGDPGGIVNLVRSAR